MKVVIRGRDFYMFWKHGEGELLLHKKNPETKKEELVPHKRRTTTCVIRSTDVDVEESATAYFKPTEVYSKEGGRYYSLQKLLRNLNLTKPERAQVWAQYFTRGNDTQPSLEELVFDFLKSQGVTLNLSDIVIEGGEHETGSPQN